MKVYTFKKSDSGYIGKAFEMAVKNALNRNNADYVSAAGRTDFVYKRKCYDTKQNGSVLKYGEHDIMVRGSKRIIYATHVAYKIVEETDENITVFIDLGNTDMFCTDRAAFLEFLLSNGHAKANASRETINIQTSWNYKKNAYHGKRGKIIEQWLDENKLFDDDIIEDILDGFYNGF